jgi:hypothetical protein
VTVDEAREVLFRNARLRFPNSKGLATGQKIDALEDYITASAIARAELEEARLHMNEAVGLLLNEWDEIVGWEVIVASSRPTQDDIRRAKKQLRPELADGIEQGRRLIARLTEQIHRLEQDEKMASRQYTFITGAA